MISLSDVAKFMRLADIRVIKDNNKNVVAKFKVQIFLAVTV